jgi:hypothetical protein
MAKKLTPITVENAKPRAGRYEIPDAACRGLHLVVQPSGAKSWAVRYRHEGKPAKLTLQPGPGEPPLTLAAARKLAAAAMYQVEQGLDPAAEKKSESRPATILPLLAPETRLSISRLLSSRSTRSPRTGRGAKLKRPLRVRSCRSGKAVASTISGVKTLKI